MKPIAVFATLAPLLGACAVPLATLPPSDTYTIVESPAPELTPDEQRLVADINKELDRLGLPVATVGGYESNAAAVLANVALARIWNGSGRTFATNNDIAATSSTATDQVVTSHKSAPGRVTSLTDEEDDAELKHLHPTQHLISRGIPAIRSWLFATPYAKTALENEDIKKAVRVLRPEEVKGDLKLGIAILPAGDSDQRIWVLTLQDHVLDLSKGPPRTIAPGASFEVAGSVVDKDKKIRAVKLGLLGPDGKVQLLKTSVDAQGQFAASVTVPSTPGLYTFGLDWHHGSKYENTLVVPIFAGVDPAVWPPSADPKATPVDGTRMLAQRLAKSLADYRHNCGLPPVPIDADLSAFSKTEATGYADVLDASTGPSSGLGVQAFFDGTSDRRMKAGVGKGHVWHHHSSDDYLNNYFTRFPDSPFIAASLSSPTVQAFGIGVALIPTTIAQDDDLTQYSLVYSVKDPTPPQLLEANPAEEGTTDGSAPPTEAKPPAPATTPEQPAAPAPTTIAPAPSAPAAEPPPAPANP